MEFKKPFFHSWSLALLLTMGGIGTALASPNILKITTSYDSLGKPASLDVIGTGFQGTVNVRLGGQLLPSSSVTVVSTTELQVNIAGISPGDDKLRVTVLPYDDDGHASVYDLTIGAVGPQGPVGPAGLAGLNGANGTNGTNGKDGAMGLPGSPGLKGDTGSTGATGMAGANGTPGVNGTNGLPGTNGTNGTNGTPGLQGPKGDTGSRGPAGTAASCPNGNTTPTQPGGQYIDCGDGTLVDTNTGLMWEKKTNTCTIPDVTDPHCYLNLYTWTEANFVFPYEPSGTLYSDFLERLNDLMTPNDGTATPCFAGHCDWRIPEIGELRGILLAPAPNCTPVPCIDPAFGPTQASFYWSSSSIAGGPGIAWGVYFSVGFVGNGIFKYNGYYARAVRGGR